MLRGRMSGPMVGIARGDLFESRRAPNVNDLSAR